MLEQWCFGVLSSCWKRATRTYVQRLTVFLHEKLKLFQHLKVGLHISTAAMLTSSVWEDYLSFCRLKIIRLWFYCHLWHGKSSGSECSISCSKKPTWETSLTERLSISGPEGSHKEYLSCRLVLDGKVHKESIAIYLSPSHLILKQPSKTDRWIMP